MSDDSREGGSEMDGNKQVGMLILISLELAKRFRRSVLGVV
ncbi:MAG: hypothetical protein ACI87W_001776 [Halieaceae bacterium]|jgi:hypothetical protein